MTIIAAAFCPHPPLLVPAVAAGERVAVRAPALAAASWLCSRPIARVVVLGSGDAARTWAAGARGSFAGFGVDLTVQLPGDGAVPKDIHAPLPLPLTVGAWLLGESRWSGDVAAMTCDASGHVPESLEHQAAGEEAVGLLVMGDGSARRSEKAPGWFDERAARYDGTVSAALAAGDPEQLAVDLALGEQLLAAGAPAWHAASRVLAGREWSAGVSYDEAPYGVGYLVATWSARDLDVRVRS